MVLPMEQLRLDTTATEGQIRTLRADRVDRLLAQMKINPPVQRAQVVVWRTAANGMPPSTPLL